MFQPICLENVMAGRNYPELTLSGERGIVVLLLQLEFQAGSDRAHHCHLR